MEDVQDGKKVSIQDGVEEDPTVEEKFELGGKTFLALRYIMQEMTNPEIIVSAETSTDSEDKTETISISVGTSVA